MNISLSAFAPEKSVSRDGFGSPVRRQPAHLRAQAEYGAYLRDSSRVSRRRPFIYLKPPYATGSVPSLSGDAIAYRWRSLPRVRRHRASKPQDISDRVLPWQVTMDQLIAPLFPTPTIGMKWATVALIPQQCVQYQYVCMVTHIARVWIKWVRLPILLVVS